MMSLSRRFPLIKPQRMLVGMATLRSREPAIGSDTKRYRSSKGQRKINNRLEALENAQKSIEQDAQERLAAIDQTQKSIHRRGMIEFAINVNEVAGLSPTSYGHHVDEQERKLIRAVLFSFLSGKKHVLPRNHGDSVVKKVAHLLGIEPQLDQLENGNSIMYLKDAISQQSAYGDTVLNQHQKSSKKSSTEDKRQTSDTNQESWETVFLRLGDLCRDHVDTIERRLSELEDDSITTGMEQSRLESRLMELEDLSNEIEVNIDEIRGLVSRLEDKSKEVQSQDETDDQVDSAKAKGSTSDNAWSSWWKHNSSIECGNEDLARHQRIKFALDKLAHGTTPIFWYRESEGNGQYSSSKQSSEELVRKVLLALGENNEYLIPDHVAEDYIFDKERGRELFRQDLVATLSRLLVIKPCMSEERGKFYISLP